MNIPSLHFPAYNSICSWKPWTIVNNPIVILSQMETLHNTLRQVIENNVIRTFFKPENKTIRRMSEIRRF